MNMKKLLTFLLVMAIASLTFGASTTWQGGAAGDWQNAGNWTGGLPALGNDPVIGATTILGGSPTVVVIYHVPTVNLNNMTITGATPSTNCDVTLRTGAAGGGGNDGQVLNFYTDAAQGSHQADINVRYGCVLHCNTAGERVDIWCHPGVRFRVESTLNASLWVDGHFYPALYPPCSFHNGLALFAGTNAQGVIGHAEFVEQNHSSSPNNGLTGVRGWVEFDFPNVTASWHEISIPVANDPTLKTGVKNICRISNCLCTFEGDYVRKYINGAGGGWDVLLGNFFCDNPILDVEVGRGYEVWAVASPKNQIYGTYNNAPVGSPITLPMAVGQTGWNFIGNPFPSGIKFTANSGSSPTGWDWDLFNIEPWVCYWDNGVPVIEGGPQYRYYNIVDGTHIPASTNDVIPRGQGFFAYAYNGFYAIKIDNQARNFQTTTSIGKSVEVSADNLLRVDLSNGTSGDEVLIKMNNQDATPNYDMKGDFYKMFQNSSDRSEIYSRTADNVNVVLNSLKPTTGTVAVPVYVNVGPTGTYTLTISENTYSAKTGILLRDTKTNTTVDLRTTPSYTFTATAGDDPARFIITFTDVLSGINNLSSNGFGFYSFENSIYVQNNTKNISGTITVYDMIGKEVVQTNLANDAITRINTNLNKGFYIVSVKTGDGLYSQKVYIN
jgi:hypothetical protein